MRAFLLSCLLLTNGCARYYLPDPPRLEQRLRASDPLLDTLQAEVAREVNRARLQNGVPLLRVDAALERAAVLYSAELAVRGTVEHRSITPTRQTASERLRAERVYFTSAGENLARIDDRVDRVAVHVVEAWLNSPTHRRTMLARDFVRGAVGVTRSPDGLWYIVQMLAASVVPASLSSY